MTESIYYKDGTWNMKASSIKFRFFVNKEPKGQDHVKHHEAPYLVL
jgi:hypothetical protein